MNEKLRNIQRKQQETHWMTWRKYFVSDIYILVVLVDITFFFILHVCCFTSFTLTKLLFFSQDIGRCCATVCTPTPDLSTHQEDVHWSCENNIWHRVWTQGHWGTLETVSTFPAVDNNNKSVTGRGHLKDWYMFRNNSEEIYSPTFSSWWN